MTIMMIMMMIMNIMMLVMMIMLRMIMVMTMMITMITMLRMIMIMIMMIMMRLMFFLEFLTTPDFFSHVPCISKINDSPEFGTTPKFSNVPCFDFWWKRIEEYFRDAGPMHQLSSDDHPPDSNFIQISVNSN